MNSAPTEVEDLVSRLRVSWSDRGWVAAKKISGLLREAREAADEIERLNATIARLQGESAKDGALMRKWVRMIDEPDVQKCGLASSLLFGIQRACRAALARRASPEQPK